MPLRLLVCVFVLVACGGTVDDREAIVDVSNVSVGDPEGDVVFEAADAEECDADVFRPAIGVDVATTVFEPSADLRIFAETDIVTQEYLPKRTNIVTDTRGVIVRVYCG